MSSPQLGLTPSNTRLASGSFLYVTDADCDPSVFHCKGSILHIPFSSGFLSGSGQNGRCPPPYCRTQSWHALLQIHPDVLKAAGRNGGLRAHDICGIQNRRDIVRMYAVHGKADNSVVLFRLIASPGYERPESAASPSLPVLSAAPHASAPRQIRRSSDNRSPPVKPTAPPPLTVPASNLCGSSAKTADSRLTESIISPPVRNGGIASRRVFFRTGRRFPSVPSACDRKIQGNLHPVPAHPPGICGALCAASMTMTPPFHAPVSSASLPDFCGQGHWKSAASLQSFVFSVTRASISSSR